MSINCDRWSLLTPSLPPEEGKKEKKGASYKLNIKTALLITLIILIIREIMQYIKNLYGVFQSWVPGTDVPPAAARQHQDIPDWPR